MPGLLDQTGLVDPGTFGDSTLVVVWSPKIEERERLRDYNARLVAFYGIPVRMVDAGDSGDGSRLLAKRIGGVAARSYVAVKGVDSLAFRARGTVPLLDEHRQLLAQLYRRPDRLRPEVPVTVEYWNQSMRAMRFESPSETVDGVELLRDAAVSVVLEADCSECRLQDQVRRLRRQGFDTVTRGVLVVARRFAAQVRDSLPRARVVSAVSALGVAPVLGLITRETAISDPIVLDIREGNVIAVRRLGRIANAGARPQ